MLPWTALSHSQGKYVSRPIASLEEALAESMLKLVNKREATTNTVADGLHPEARSFELLRRQLRYLQRVLSESHYYAKRKLFTIAWTEMAAHYSDYPADDDAEGPSQLDEIVAPLLLQPVYLAGNKELLNVGTTEDNRCCPGHCGMPRCIELCFNSMMEFMHSLESPLCSLTKDEIHEAFFPDSHFSPEQRAGTILAEQGVDKVAQLLFDRVLGDMPDFTHAPARLAGFCRCESTIQQLERLRPLTTFNLNHEGKGYDIKAGRSRMQYSKHNRDIWGV